MVINFMVLSDREFWIKQLRRYESLKLVAKRPDRVQECINALLIEGKEKKWM